MKVESKGGTTTEGEHGFVDERHLSSSSEEELLEKQRRKSDRPMLRIDVGSSGSSAGTSTGRPGRNAGQRNQAWGPQRDVTSRELQLSSRTASGVWLEGFHEMGDDAGNDVPDAPKDEGAPAEDVSSDAAAAADTTDPTPPDATTDPTPPAKPPPSPKNKPRDLGDFHKQNYGPLLKEHLEAVLQTQRETVQNNGGFVPPTDLGPPTVADMSFARNYDGLLLLFKRHKDLTNKYLEAQMDNDEKLKLKIEKKIEKFKKKHKKVDFEAVDVDPAEREVMR